LRLSDAQRSLLAAAAKRVGRKGLFGIGTIVTPDTLLRWYRRLVARKRDGRRVRGVGRPKSAAEIERLIMTMARANPGWGYTRIRGALYNLAHEIARNLTDAGEGFLRNARHLIHDRDSLFSKDFRGILQAGGVETVKLPARSPNLNAYAERFVRSIKSECLSKIIPLGERHLRLVVSEYVEHYHVKRNRHGLDNRLIERSRGQPPDGGRVARCERLGGVLNFYYREAA